MTDHSNKISALVRNRWLQHLLFWALSFYVLCRFFAYRNEIAPVDVIYTFLFHLSVWLAVYVNLLVLIPRFFKPARYITYVIGLILMTLIAVGFNFLTFNWLADILFPGYYFISYYSFWEILQFIIIYISVTTLLKLSKSWFELERSRRWMARLESEKLDAELNALKSQVNPHFLFNSLNNLYSLSLDADRRVPDIILRLSRMMRYLLYETDVSRIPLSREISHLENYIAMHKLRVGEQADVTFTANGRLEDHSIAPLLLTPLVENSFKHGLKSATENAFVRIRLDVTANRLTFEISNNKGQTDEIEPEKSRGVGLDNLKRRLQLLYPADHELIIDDGPEVFNVQLWVNL